MLEINFPNIYFKMFEVVLMDDLTHSISAYFIQRFSISFLSPRPRPCRMLQMKVQLGCELSSAEQNLYIALLCGQIYCYCLGR